MTLEDLDRPIDQSRLDWVRGQLARIQYKSNWTLRVDTSDKYASPAIVAQFEAPDSRNLGETVTPEIAFLVVDAPEDEISFMNWCLAALMLAEIHETSENFLVDGVMFRDPHAADNRKWDLAMHTAISDASRAGNNPVLAVIFSAAVGAVESGSVIPEYMRPSGCIDALVRNLPPRYTTAPAVAATA